MDLYLKMKEIGGDGCLGERDLIKQPTMIEGSHTNTIEGATSQGGHD